MADPGQVIRAPGPWTHRDISANGARFHIVEAGEGPALILLHGFPLFWWTWRRQLIALAEAGYRAIAMDLRGYGGSDHPPRGYNPPTLAADVTGVMRSLGETQAVVVGHGWGGVLAWSLPVLEPGSVRAIMPISMPHPRTLRAAARTPGRQQSALSYLAGLQVPFAPEASLTRHNGARIERLLHRWSATPGWPDAETAAVYREAFLRWPTAHTAIEYHRWAIRSLLRTDGLRYMKQMTRSIEVPVLHVHGMHDPMLLLSSCDGSEEWVTGPYAFEEVQAGHFPHEEAADETTSLLLRWLPGVTS